MTEIEAMSVLHYLLGCENAVDAGEIDEHNCLNSQEKEALKFVLEEIQQYRAIGLTPELIEAMQGHNIALINDLGEYQSIGTIEEFKALKEKNTPYKPNEYEDRYYACKCDNILLPKWKKYPTILMPKSEGLPHCMACGQKLDWSE